MEPQKNNSAKGKTSKSSLISAIIGVGIAIFTFVCCGLLIPLGLIGAAVFLHQYRIPLIIFGVLMVGVSIFFMLKGKDIICICKVFDLIKKHKKLTIISTGIITCISLAIFAVSNFLFPPARNFTSPINPESTILEWRNNKAESEIVRIVNFLEGNIGKEIELAGERRLITGKEIISIKVIMLECCTKGEFREMLENVSKTGRVKSFDFSKKEILAELPADEIPKIADIWNVERVSFESKSRETWLQLIK
ncbi:hypothetical protein KKE13_01075 [Patescibacteria group bacterium]|nr:hypothetical protein [Patescibacteria group bacterium]